MVKDTVISAARKRKEIIAAAVCLGLAIMLNVGCILYYHTSFTELFTQIGYTFCIALALYIFYTILRLIFRLFRK